MHTSKAIANCFLGRGDEDNIGITPMMINKLVFLAHGWHLAIEGKPLIVEPVQAWDYGPVIEVLYHEFKIWGGRPIGSKAMEWRGIKRVEAKLPPRDEENLTDFLDRIWEVYNDYDAFGLSAITHEEGSPWYKAVYELKIQTIPNELIRLYYLEKLNGTEDN